MPLLGEDIAQATQWPPTGIEIPSGLTRGCAAVHECSKWSRASHARRPTAAFGRNSKARAKRVDPLFNRKSRRARGAVLSREYVSILCYICSSVTISH